MSGSSVTAVLQAKKNSALPSRCGAAVTGTGAVLIAVGFVLGVYLPGQARRERAERELAAVHQAVRSLPERAREIEDLRGQIQAAEEYLALPGSGRDPGMKTSEIVDWVSAIADASHVTLVRLEPQGQPTAADRRLDLIGEGKTSAVARLIYALETESRRVSIDAVSLASRESGEGIVARIGLTVHAGRERFSDLAEFDARTLPLAADPVP